MSLTKNEKIAIFNSLSEAHKKKMATAMSGVEMSGNGMKGAGFMDFLKKIGSGLAEIAKTIGPTLIKEFLLPYVKSKMAGNGPRLPGGGIFPAGAGTSLPGGAKKKRGRPKKVVGAGYGDLQI